MDTLNKKAFEGLIFFIVAMAALIFLPAWTVNYWQAWIFLAVFTLSVLAITVWLMKHDPKLLQRRVNAGSAAEKEKSQKIIQFVAQIAFIAIIVFPPLDHRLGWSSVPSFAAIIGDVLVVLGLYIVFLTFKENSFTSAIIEVGAEQKVVSTGPYSIVRHPMYIGALIMLLGLPVALGSFWGILMIIPITATIIIRLLQEEKFLSKNLPGYLDYKTKVKSRLLPWVW